MGVNLSCAINKDVTAESMSYQSIQKDDIKELDEQQLKEISEMINEKEKLSTPTLKLRTVSSKNNCELLSTGFKLSDPEWDVYFSNYGIVNVSTVFDEVKPRNSFNLIIKVCGRKLTSNEPNTSQNRSQSMGSFAISETGTRIITAKMSALDGAEPPLLKYIKLTGPGVIGARDLSPGANRIVASWLLLNQCHYFYSRVKVNTTHSDTLFGMCWFYFVQFGLRDNFGQRSIWLNVCQTKSIRKELSCEIIQVDENAKASEISTEDAVIFQYAIPFAWELDANYHVLIRYQIVGGKQQYTIYFYFQDESSWKKIAVLQFENDGFKHSPLFASFIEGKIRNEKVKIPGRKALFGPCWYENGNEWKQVERVNIQDDNVLQGTSAIVDENKVILLMEESPIKRRIDCKLSLKVKTKIPFVLQTLPE